jgi:hypothetical protein
VLVLHIDCTRTGAAPPTVTPPMLTCLVVFLCITYIPVF